MATNHLFNVASKDGTAFRIFSRNIPLQKNRARDRKRGRARTPDPIF